MFGAYVCHLSRLPESINTNDGWKYFFPSPHSISLTGAQIPSQLVRVSTQCAFLIQAYECSLTRERPVSICPASPMKTGRRCAGHYLISVRTVRITHTHSFKDVHAKTLYSWWLRRIPTAMTPLLAQQDEQNSKSRWQISISTQHPENVHTA